MHGPDYFTGSVFEDYIGEREERLASARRLSAMLARLQPEGRLLDVGCATGFFLEPAAQFWEVTGVELSEFAAEYARREFGHTVYTGDLADVGIPDASFDVVTLWNTIEHVADAREVMKHVARVAAPGALIVLTTGNVSGPLARRDLAKWGLMTPPAHLYFFGPRTITRLLEDTGLIVRRIAQDGRVATSGAFATRLVRTAASVLGLGDLMTVFARRPSEARLGRSLPRGLERRFRPIARV
jgi:2-polyprenyl-3-methyl-5-hydroxy-6-metoxy-1,4-benzoquinol methylase